MQNNKMRGSKFDAAANYQDWFHTFVQTKNSSHGKVSYLKKIKIKPTTTPEANNDVGLMPKISNVMHVTADEFSNFKPASVQNHNKEENSKMNKKQSTVKNMTMSDLETINSKKMCENSDRNKTCEKTQEKKDNSLIKTSEDSLHKDLIGGITSTVLENIHIKQEAEEIDEEICRIRPSVRFLNFSLIDEVDNLNYRSKDGKDTEVNKEAHENVDIVNKESSPKIKTQVEIKVEKIDDVLFQEETIDGVQIKQELFDDIEVKQEIYDDEDEFEDDIIILHNDSIYNTFQAETSDINVENNSNTIKADIHDDNKCLDEDSLITKQESCTVGKDKMKKRKIYTCKCGFMAHHKEMSAHKKNICFKLKSRKSITKEKDYVRIKCSKCNDNFSNLYGYVGHLSRHNFTPYTCPQCLNVFDAQSKLSKHLNAHILHFFPRVKETSEEDELNANSEMYFKCRKCDERVKDSSEFFEHWERHLVISDRKKCLLDQEQYSNNDLKTSQVVESLSPEMLAKALDMIKMFDGTKKTGRDCFICRRLFTRYNDGKRHLIEHFLAHAYTLLPENGGLKCEVCAKVFQKRDKFRYHMRNHAALPAYRCKYCSKSFSDSSNVSKHMKTHATILALICDICKRKFRAKHSLEKHMQLHMVLEPIKCKCCPKIFHSVSQYKKHLKNKHEKPLAKQMCPVCKKQLNSFREKWDHLWSQHRQRNVEADCPVCKVQFRKVSDVKRHVKLMHAPYVLGKNYLLKLRKTDNWK